MTTTNRNDLTAQLTSFSAALTADYPDTETWVLNKVPYKRGDLLAMVTACIQALATAAADHRTWIASTADAKAKKTALTPVLAAFKRTLEAEYGEGSTKLAQYGYVPAHAPVKDAATKAASAAKAKATRAAKKAALAGVTAQAAAVPATPAAPVAGGSAPATGGSAVTPGTAAAPAGGSTPAKQ
jgi:hypothetical protein